MLLRMIQQLTTSRRVGVGVTVVTSGLTLLDERRSGGGLLSGPAGRTGGRVAVVAASTARGSDATLSRRCSTAGGSGTACSGAEGGRSRSVACVLGQVTDASSGRVGRA